MPSRLEHKPSVNSKQAADDAATAEFLRQGIRLLIQMFIELEISNQIEAAPHERNHTRRSHRNGYRRRTWITSLGEITLEIPKLRKGTYYPAFLDAVRQSEPFLLETLRETFYNGVDVSKLKAMVARVGLSPVDYAQISDTVEQLYDLVDRFRDKPRNRHVSNIITFRPVNAISTLLVDSRITDDETLPQSYYQQLPNDWLADSVDVLIRLRQALSNQTDAIAA